MKGANRDLIDSKGLTPAGKSSRRGSPNTPWSSSHRHSGAHQEKRVPLKRQPRAQLDLPTRSGGLRDRAKLRRIHEAVGRAQVGVIEAIKEFAAKLESHSFGNSKVANYREVKSLRSGPVDRVSTNISKGEGGRSDKRGGVEPAARRLRARSKLVLAGGVGANGILSQHCAGIRGVAEHRNGKRETGLHLIYGRNVPISRDRIGES